jgi:hypothetical protein
MFITAGAFARIMYKRNGARAELEPEPDPALA